MKLTSHAIYTDDSGELPHCSAVYTFDKGTSLDLVVKHLEACGKGNKDLCDADLQEVTELQAAVKALNEEKKALLYSNKNLDDNINIAKQNLDDAWALFDAESSRLRKDVADKVAALQEIQGTYGRLVTEIKQVRSDYEKVVIELDAVRLENVALKRHLDETEAAAPANGPVGEDPKTGEYVYEEPAKEVANVPDDVATPPAPPVVKSPEEQFREQFTKDCAAIKGTGASEVLDQAYSAYIAHKDTAIQYGLQRELGTAITMAIADNLNKEPADAGALFSVKLDSIRGKAAEALAAEAAANEPELVTQFNEAMNSAPVKAKTSLRQKTVAALALVCARDGKVKLSDMQTVAQSLRKVTLTEGDWSVLLDKGDKPKSMLDTLHKIVATSLELTVV